MPSEVIAEVRQLERSDRRGAFGCPEFSGRQDCGAPASPFAPEGFAMFMVSIGSGVLLKGKVLDDAKLLINVGANVVVERDFPETKKIIDEQIKEIVDAQESLRKELRKFVSE